MTKPSTPPPFARLAGAPLILASTSHARRRMFDAAGLVYESLAPGVDEESLLAAAKQDALSPEDTAILLAETKARAIAHRRPEAVVVAGDQLLVLDGVIYSKPKTQKAAETRLRLLAGKTHALVTAGIMHHASARLWHFVATTHITIRPVTDAFIAQYCHALGAESFPTPGVYMLEGLGMHIITGIDGCAYAALGFPMLECLAHLRAIGLDYG